MLKTVKLLNMLAFKRKNGNDKIVKFDVYDSNNSKAF